VAAVIDRNSVTCRSQPLIHVSI